MRNSCSIFGGMIFGTTGNDDGELRNLPFDFYYVLINGGTASTVDKLFDGGNAKSTDTIKVDCGNASSYSH